MKRRLVAPYITVFVYNGWEGNGFRLNDLDRLFSLLKTQTLMRSVSSMRIPTDENGEHLYPTDKRIVRFAGNFEGYSHAFCIDTSDPALIAAFKPYFETK
jgi:hypothetical protein